MFKIFRNRVAIVPIENPDKVGSLWIPETAKDRLNQGFVKYAGPSVRDLKIGDYVLFSGYTGTLTHVEGEGKLIIMPERFVIAVMCHPQNLDVPGLYFRDRPNAERNKVELAEIISTVLPDLDTDSAMSLATKLSARGVTGPTSSPYYTANYELTMGYIAQTFSESKEWRDKIQVVNTRLKPEDLDDPDLDENVDDEAAEVQLETSV